MKLFSKRAAVSPAPERAGEEVPIPAGALIATRTGDVAHRKSALRPGADCEALSEWTDWRLVGEGEGFRPCHRCELALEGRDPCGSGPVQAASSDESGEAT